MTHSDQLYLINTALLECAIANNASSDDFYIRQVKETKEWRIVRYSDKRIMFKKIFGKPKNNLPVS